MTLVRTNKSPPPGARFGKLVVLEAGFKHRGYYAARVRCDCGAEMVRLESNLLRPTNVGCGACARPPKMIACGRCGVEIKARNHRTRFCSKSCAKRHDAALKRAARPPPPPKPPKPTLVQRLWRQIAVGDPGACWEWQGARAASGGYGVLRENGKTIRASRLVLELASGQPIPPRMFACHHCDNPPCCNPLHLFIGTPRDNMQDMIRKRRGRNQGGPWTRFRRRDDRDQTAAEG
jgi:hypothetical protein